MASLTTELAEILHTVQRPGDFYTTGTIDIFAHAWKWGRWPHCPATATRPGPAAHRRRRAGSYGQGEATLIDTEVRRTWQIDPERVQIGGRRGSRPWRTSWRGRPPASG